MKNIFKTILKLSFIFTIILLSSCEKEEFQEPFKNKSSNSDISFEQFKNETGLKDFETSISINQNPDNLQARNADGSYELSDFVIDTEMIKKAVIEEKVSYTFEIHPKIIMNNHIFNLTVFKIANEWKTSVLELIPTEQNREDLKNGATENFKGQIIKIYDSSIDPLNPSGARVIIFYHCHGCEGACDLCNQCVTVSPYDPDPRWIGGEFLTGGGVTIGGDTSGGGGESGSIFQNPYYYDPTAYIVDPNFASFQNDEMPIRVERAAEFWDSLTNVPNAQEWAQANTISYNSIVNYYLNNYTPANKIFAKEIIDLAKVEQDQTDVNNLINIATSIYNAGDSTFEDDFALTLDPYVDLDLETLTIPPSTFNPHCVVLQTYLNYRLLRQMNPTWSKAKCAWEASKDIIHISLDAFGLIPVVGEVADLTNGVLYTIEGDGLNETLSYAGAIPIVGWASTGTKFGIKLAATATGTTKFVWKVTNNVIEFGNRGQLRKVLNLAVGNPLVAHHIIPWAKSTNEVVQKAAKSANAFHMNEALNGIPLSIAVHNGSHAAYDQRVLDRLLDIKNQYGPNMTPQQAYNGLTILINDIKTAILNNPTTPINQLIF